MVVLPIIVVLLVILMLPLVITGFTLDMVTVAVAKLGFSPSLAILLLAAIVIGSSINIPLYQRSFRAAGMTWHQRSSVVSLNVGGGLIPVILAVYQLTRGYVLPILVTTGIVTLVSYWAAQVVPGQGIRMNAMVSPLTAVVCAWFVGAVAAPSIAFAGGILGTLIGADLLHLSEIERLSPGHLSIGGAGIFDGIALCGLFALLLA